MRLYLVEYMPSEAQERSRDVFSRYSEAKDFVQGMVDEDQEIIDQQAAWREDVDEEGDPDFGTQPDDGGFEDPFNWVDLITLDIPCNRRGLMDALQGSYHRYVTKKKECI